MNDSRSGSWAQAFSAKAERQLWQFVCDSPGDARDFASRGFRPADVLLRSPDPTDPAPAVLLIVDPAPPCLRRADGRPLPDRLRRFEHEQPDIDMLRALGFEVQMEDRRARFVEATTTGLLLEVDGDPLIAGVLRVRENETGHTCVESPAVDGAGESVLEVTSLGEALSHLAGMLGTGSARVIAVSSPDRPTESVLKDIQPLADVHRGQSLRVHGLGTTSVFGFDGRWAFTPDDPPRWPTYLRHGEWIESVGELIITSWGGFERARPLGWEGHTSGGIEHALACLPALRVRRTKADGSSSVANVWRSVSGDLALHSGRRAPRLLDEGDLIAAVAKTVSLREIRPNELTEIWIGPRESSRPDDLLPVLRFTKPTTEEDPLAWNGSSNVYPLGVLERVLEALDWGVPDGISSRAAFLNGCRVLAVSVDDRARPALALASDEHPFLPDLMEVWTFQTFTETESMTSGLFVSQMGLLDQGSIAGLTNDYDGDPQISCRVGHADQRLHEIVYSLVDIQELLMLAVEIVIGAVGDGEEVRESLIDEDGSPTAYVSLSIAIDDHEVEEFLRLVGRSGGQDTIDAIRQPLSTAGLARSKRLAREAHRNSA